MTKDQIVYRLKESRLQVVAERTKIAENTLRALIHGKKKTRTHVLERLAQHFGSDGYHVP